MFRIDNDLEGFRLDDQNDTSIDSCQGYESDHEPAQEASILRSVEPPVLSSQQIAELTLFVEESRVRAKTPTYATTKELDDIFKLFITNSGFITAQDTQTLDIATIKIINKVIDEADIIKRTLQNTNNLTRLDINVTTALGSLLVHAIAEVIREPENITMVRLTYKNQEAQLLKILATANNAHASPPNHMLSTKHLSPILPSTYSFNTGSFFSRSSSRSKSAAPKTPNHNEPDSRFSGLN